MPLRPNLRTVAERFLRYNPVVFTEARLRRYAAECWLDDVDKIGPGWTRTSECLAFADAVVEEALALRSTKAIIP